MIFRMSPPPPHTPAKTLLLGPRTLDSQLLRALVRRKADAQDRPHHTAKLDNLLHAALDNIHRDRKAHTAVGT